MTQTTRYTWAGIAIAVVGIAITLFARGFEWNLIGGAIGLFSILVMLGNQAAVAHGYGYDPARRHRGKQAVTKTSESVGNAPGRDRDSADVPGSVAPAVYRGF